MTELECEKEERLEDERRYAARAQFQRSIIELAGGLIGGDSVKDQFNKMLADYKQQILGGWDVKTAMLVIHAKYGIGNKTLPLARQQIDRLFMYYFLSIGFRPEIWLDGHSISWSNVEL